MRFATGAWLSCLLAASLVACSGSSGGGSSPDLQVTGLSIDTAAIEIAHTIDIEAVVKAGDEPVALALKILNQADYDHNNDPANAGNQIEIRQYDLDPPIQLDGRATTVNARLRVPADVAPGSYYIGAQIDPLGLVDEPDDENNILIQELGYDFDEAWSNTPNLVLQEFVFEPDRFTVTRKGIQPPSGTLHSNHDAFGVRLTVSATGSQDLTGVQIGVSDVILSAGDPFLPFSVNQAVMQVLLDALAGMNVSTDLLRYWDNELGDYLPVFTFDIAAGETKDLHLDLQVDYDELNAILSQLPDSVWDLVFAGIPSQQQWLQIRADVTLEIDPDNLIGEYEPEGYDNAHTGTLTVMIDSQLPQCAFERSYEKIAGTSDFGAGVSASSGVSFDSKGFHASAEVGVPIQLFGEQFDLLGFQALGDRNPMTELSQYTVVLEFGGFPIFSHTIEDDQGFDWSKDLPFEKEKESKPKTFFPGGFPITVLATVKASVGLGVQVNSGVTKDFLVAGGPFANLAVGASGYPGVPGQPVTPGFGIDLTLLEDRLNTTASTDMTFSAFPACSYTGSLDFDVTNRITTLDGKVYVWVELDWPKFCKKWGFLPYPCGWKKKKFTFDIVNWKGLTLGEQVLIEKQCAVVDPIVVIGCP